MNKVYRVVKNKSTGQWVAASEISTGQSKGKSVKKLLLTGVSMTLAAAFTVLPSAAHAAPVIKTDAHAVGGVITVTEAEVASVGTVALPPGGGIGESNNGGIDVRASGGNSIVIEGGNADISTSGGIRTVGIYAEVAVGGTGDITIGSALKPLSGSIETTDLDSVSFSTGLLVNNEGTGKTSIYSSANIDTLGRGGRGIQVFSKNAAGGDIVIESSGNITLHSNNNPYAAIQVEDKGAGNIYVTSSGDMIGKEVAANKNSIFIHKGINATGNINIGYAGNGSVKAITGTLTSLADGWQVYGWHEGAGDINVQIGNATIKNGIDRATTDSTILAHYKPAAAVLTKQSNILINVGGAVIEHTGAGDTAGIEAKHEGTLGEIALYSDASVTTKGVDTDGILARYTADIQGGKITLINKGNITTYGDKSKGIYALASTGTGTADISVASSGHIVTNGNGASHGILVENIGIGNGTVVADGAHVTTNGTGVNNHGVEAKAENGDSTIIFKNGSVTIGASGSAGLAAYQSTAGASATAKAKVEVRNSTVDASKSYGQHGVSAFAQGGGQVYIDAQTKVHGGWDNNGSVASGVAIGGAVQRLENYGSIDAMSDFAIRGSRSYGGAGDTLTIDNYGSITGYLTAGAEDTAFNNAGSWDIRKFVDTTGVGVRDTKGVAISDFGAGTDTFVNAAKGIIRLAAVTGEATIDTAGEYTPIGAQSMSQPGIVHGQLLNLNRFENAGVIDMTGNRQAGDVFVITGGATAGSNGGGSYISNGGSVRLDTMLNEGDAISQSDILVVDNVTLGTGATRVFIKPVAGSVGGQTIGDGIKVIEVLGTQDANSFVLGAPVTYGQYEYLLNAGTAGNWYLTNMLNAVTPIINPNAGSYLGNQYAAMNLFGDNVNAGRNHNRGMYEAGKPEQTLWVTANYSELESDLFSGKQHIEIESNLFQIGADVLTKGDYVLGVYGGYGTSSINNKSRQTLTTADGQVTGYNLGVYGNWAPEENKGPYVDVWGYYAWFDNKLKGAAQQYAETKYDSTGYSVSVQTGYGFEVLERANGNTLVLEPHARLSYSSIDADNFYDNSFTYYNHNKGSGIQTQLGARLYGNIQTQNKRMIKPYVELNWLHNNADNGISLNGAKLDSNIGKNVGEVRIGAQSQATDRLSIWGHLGAQKGSQSFKRNEIQVGVGWQW